MALGLPSHRSRTLRRAVLLALMGVLPGCVATGYVSNVPVNTLTREEAAGLDRVDAFVWVTENAVRPPTLSEPVPTRGSPPSTVSTVKHTANQFAYRFDSLWLADRAASINSALQSFDFGSELMAITTAKMSKVDGIAVTVLPVVVRDRAAGLAQFDASHASGVPNSWVTYDLMDKGQLRFTALAVLIPKVEALKKYRPKPNDANPLSFDNAVYVKEITVVVVPSATDAAQARAVFIAAANDLDSQLATDLGTSR